MRGKGYQADASKGSDGDPIVRSAASGAKFTIIFYGCTGGRNCSSIQFYAGFKAKGSVAVGKMNEWNRTKRFGGAYLDNDSDPVIEMDVNLDAGGMSRALFEDTFELWSTTIGDYRTFIN